MGGAIQRVLRFATVLSFFQALTSYGALIYTYDFPNSPASGLAIDQTNPQPGLATFSDFTRTNLTYSANNWFSSTGWSQNGSIDTTQYEGFSITSSPGWVMDLTSLTFSLKGESNAAASMRVALFLNGSSTAYATYDFSPTSSFVTYTFDFTDLTNADAVTSAEFRFFGWGATSTNGKIYLDDVATFGTLPEAETLGPVILLLSLVLIGPTYRQFRRCVQ